MIARGPLRGRTVLLYSAHPGLTSGANMCRRCAAGVGHTAESACPHMGGASFKKIRVKGVGQECPTHTSYLSTYLANIFSGSMAMKMPRLRARTSLSSFRISAVL